MLLYKDFHKVHYDVVALEKKTGKEFPDMGKGSTQRIYVFQNGYGASVVNGYMSFGHDELAVIYWDEVPKLYRSKTKRLKKKLCKKLLVHHVTYSTPITSDVKRYSDHTELNKDLIRISKLEKRCHVKVLKSMLKEGGYTS